MLPFNRPYMTGRELDFIRQAHANGKLSGDGPFTARCHARLEQQLGTGRALLTPSCSSALEMAALIAGVGPGDEVIMPSYTFTSTANAFVLRGAVPVFVDVCPDTMNLDASLIEPAITPRTRVIVPVHYAGVSCDMGPILEIAARHGLMVIEDAAQGFGATWQGRALGSIATLGCLSFHETKNVTCGEGGALLVNDPALVQRAERVREKGTNRSAFFRGEVDKYTWCEAGSSGLVGELAAAFLWAQLLAAEDITARRLAIWHTYHEALAKAERQGWLRRPRVPQGCMHNAHMYYVLLPSLEARSAVIRLMRHAGVQAVFHYVPLHASPAGRRFGRVSGSMRHTEVLSDRLLRLPLWIGVDAKQVLGALLPACAAACVPA
jgi:dTDP-4-amino-4,6-dideoxygalactose transaminase